jgi:hypothetical protein
LQHYVLIKKLPMAKQKITDAIQKQYDKPQFQIGAAVFFSWMGYKQCGYVTKIKKVNWGIMYTVQSIKGTRYPCGIEIKGQKTQYNTGCIYIEETRSIGQSELIKYIQLAKKPGGSANLPRNPNRSENEGGIDSELRDGDVAEDSGKDTKPDREEPGTDMAAAPSIKGVSRSATRKRGVSNDKELDSAIEKQRNFLSGFVKKD